MILESLLLLTCGAIAGALTAALLVGLIAREVLIGERIDAQGELRRAMNDANFWKHEAKRLRASLDGAAAYKPTFPRPLSPR